MWSTEDMKNALIMYFSQRAPGYTGPVYGHKKIAGIFGIPRETFKWRLSGPLRGLFGHLSGGKDLPCIFTTNEEVDLAGHISSFAQSGFPFTLEEIRSLAYEKYTIDQGIEGFSAIHSNAVRKWFGGFLRRQDGLALKSP